MTQKDIKSEGRLAGHPEKNSGKRVDSIVGTDFENGHQASEDKVVFAGSAATSGGLCAPSGETKKRAEMRDPPVRGSVRSAMIPIRLDLRPRLKPT